MRVPNETADLESRGTAGPVPVDLDAATGRNVSSGSVFSTILLTHAIRSAAVTRSARVVDVGCGESPFRDLLEPELYVGIDRSPRTRTGDPAVIADAAQLPVATAMFDGVLCTEVIEHVPDERALAAELARVARPGAQLLLSSPFVHGLHEVPFDYRRLTSIGLATVLSEAGWHVEEVLSIGGPLVTSLDSFVRWMNSKCRSLSRRLFRTGSGPDVAVQRGSAAMQRRLAWLALRLPRSHVGRIDPMAPSPSLTLGYVVLARRRTE